METNEKEVEKRGRKPVADPIEPVKLWVNNSIICGGEVLKNDTQEYKERLADFKEVLMNYIKNGG